MNERLSFAMGLVHARPPDIISKDLKTGENVTIGRDGFGWVRQEDGTLFKMPHTGNVRIESNVEIGSNVCIDRAVIGETLIGEGTKLDNLIHIGHGAQIGKHCLIVAGSVIGGSAIIGDRTFIGMNVSIKNKIKVGNDCYIGAGAVVVKDIPDGETWAGVPAKKIEKPITWPEFPPKQPASIQ